MASDDSSVINEIRDAASTYFPFVEQDRIVWISGEEDDGSDIQPVNTRTSHQVATFPAIMRTSVYGAVFNDNVPGNHMKLLEPDLQDSLSAKSLDS